MDYKLPKKLRGFRSSPVDSDCGLAGSSYNGDDFGYALELGLTDSNDR